MQQSIRTQQMNIGHMSFAGTNEEPIDKVQDEYSSSTTIDSTADLPKRVFR
ncbi:unnamed protein product [Sphenostylis stenocarpa]|uniref:Uncharacterized protein n=1 Tax=Sphenostylis stenocarpa TaxID=92480 RepID=A0AA86SVT7_9FABA|nr:unnamed protein product [Sphenostylis stenocarpa]